MRRIVRDHAVEDLADGVEVALAVGGAGGLDHFRRDEAGSPGQRRRFALGDDEAGIAEFGDAADEDDVVGLDVPVDQIGIVHDFDSGQQFPDDLHRLFGGEFPVAAQKIAQRGGEVIGAFAAVVGGLHGVEESLFGLADVVDPQQIGMEPGDPHIVPDPLQFPVGAARGADDLDGDLPADGVLRQVGHAVGAPPADAKDLAPEKNFTAFKKCRHPRSSDSSYSIMYHTNPKKTSGGNIPPPLKKRRSIKSF